MQSGCGSRPAVSRQCDPAELLQHGFEVFVRICSQADVTRRSQQLPTGVCSDSMRIRFGVLLSTTISTPGRPFTESYWRNEEHIAGGFVDNPLNNTTTNNWYGSGLLGTYSHAITPRLMVTGGVSWTSEIFLFNQQKPIGSFAGVEPSPDGGVFLPGINFGGGPWEPLNWGTMAGSTPSIANTDLELPTIGSTRAAGTTSTLASTFGAPFRMTRSAKPAPALEFRFCDDCGSG